MPFDPFKNIEYPSLHDLSHQYPPVDWLWPSWIPNGMVTLFGAAPGVGKSLVALDLARRIIHGRPFPDGAPGYAFGREVLIVDAEGTPALLNQRAQAWGLNTKRLYLLPAPDDGLIDLGQLQQVRLLTRMMLNIQPALVIIDSLAAAYARGETSLQGARALLGSLASLAKMFDVALLVIHHLRKRSPSGPPASTRQVAIDDLRGSSHLSAAARSVLALSVSPVHPEPTLSLSRDLEGPIEAPTSSFSQGPEALALNQSKEPSQVHEGSPEGAPHPTSPSPTHGRRLEVVKTNLCQQPPPLSLHFEGDSMAVPTLRYAQWVEPPPPPTQLQCCARWLLQFLAAAGEPLKPADVVRAAREQGFTRPTLYRARQALAGQITDLGNSPHDPNKRWTLAAKPAVSPSPEERSTHPET